jgi:hypothetical protein
MPRNKHDKDKTFSFSELDIVVYDYRVSEGHLSICDFGHHFESIGRNPSRIKSPKREQFVSGLYDMGTSSGGAESFSSDSSSDMSTSSKSESSLSERATFRLKNLHAVKIE